MKIKSGAGGNLRGICASLATCLGGKFLGANVTGFTPMTIWEE